MRHHVFCNYMFGPVGGPGCICIPGRGNQDWPGLKEFQETNVPGQNLDETEIKRIEAAEPSHVPSPPTKENS